MFRHGCSPLHLAAINDRMQVTRALLREDTSSSPSNAAMGDFMQIARFLLGAESAVAGAPNK